MDNNGEYLPGEGLVMYAHIELFRDGQKINDWTTDEDGEFVFANLEPGLYVVTETDPEGWTSTLNSFNPQVHANQTTKIYIPDYPLATPTPTTPPTSTPTWTPPPVGLVSGWIWVDLNRNGQPDANELPVTGVRVILLDGHNTQLGLKTTDAQGQYEFGEIAPGLYTLRSEGSPGYMPDASVEMQIVVSAGRVTNAPLGLPPAQRFYMPVSLKGY